MSLKDINLDSDGEAIFIDGDFCTDTYSEDTIFWRLRNTLIKVFTKNTTFWDYFKGSRYLDKVEFEENIKNSMITELNRLYPSDNDLMYLRIEVIIVDSIAYIFSFRIQPFEKDDLLIDFSIKL
ncbi:MULTISPECIES: hypothetical protein [Bacteria]|uniref:hypothetical protein n=1 Tax=Bacteria TaxID=2 RepID=UPI002E7ADE8E|nr:hypothetical protein [Cetobacterium somerae]WVJ02993.1 hypothetical protein VSU16_14780 [Cetobacterium somerae]